MRKNIFTIIATFSVAIICLLTHNRVKNEIEYGTEKDSPDEPYEAFMLQRTYPNKVFDIHAYQSALSSAVVKTQQQRTRSSVSWTLEGPGNIGGRFNCIAVNPGNANVMYAGSANGGVWKTTDNASNWFPVFDSIPFLAIGAIAINPNDTNEIWVGTGDVNISGTMYMGNGVYKSLDAGHTWNYIGLADSYVVSSIIFNTSNTQEVLVATMGNSFFKDNNRGIYRTIDDGANFTLTKFVNDSTGIIDMIQHPSNPSIIYASSFTRIRTESQSLTEGTEVYIYESTDFGQTWNILSGGLPNGLSHDRLGIALCKNSPGRMYAFYSTSDLTMPELYTTTDGGLNWTQVNISQFDMNSYGTYGWYFGKIYVDPVDPNTLYVPGIDLQYSTDGGVTWNMRTPPWYFYVVHGDGHYIYFTSSNEYIYCTDGGLYKTIDGGSNWTNIENIPNNQFYAITEDPGNHGEYAGGVQDNGTMFGNASVFNNFTRISGGDGFIVAYTHDPLLVYSESQNGAIIFDDNYPSGFQQLIKDTAQLYNWETPYFVSTFGDDTVFLAGQRVMEIDGAPYGTFTNISPVLNDPASPWRVSNISSIAQSKLNSAILYAGTADGKVWNTLSRGIFWNDITPFPATRYYITTVKPSPNDAATAYVTRSGYRSNDNTPLVYKTINNGMAWTDISGDLPLLAVNDIEIYPGNENIIFIANDAGVYVTTNGGINWARLGDNMPYVAVLDIALNYNSTKIIAGTFGRSMYTIDITNIITGVTPLENNLSVEIYPNPASDIINIKTISKIDDAFIYSANGSLVLKSKLNSINVSDFPVGNYFIDIRQGERMVVKKFLKM